MQPPVLPVKKRKVKSPDLPQVPRPHQQWVSRESERGRKGGELVRREGRRGDGREGRRGEGGGGEERRGEWRVRWTALVE